MASKIPVCPLMSAMNELVICQQEDCAWYLKNYKICSMYMIAHNAALDVKAKQPKKEA